MLNFSAIGEGDRLGDVLIIPGGLIASVALLALGYKKPAMIVGGVTIIYALSRSEGDLLNPMSYLPSSSGNSMGNQ